MKGRWDWSVLMQIPVTAKTQDLVGKGLAVFPQWNGSSCWQYWPRNVTWVKVLRVELLWATGRLVLLELVNLVCLLCTLTPFQTGIAFPSMSHGLSRLVYLTQWWVGQLRFEILVDVVMAPFLCTWPRVFITSVKEVLLMRSSRQNISVLLKSMHTEQFSGFNFNIWSESCIQLLRRTSQVVRFISLLFEGPQIGIGRLNFFPLRTRRK